MRADITWTGEAKTNQIGKVVFKLNKTELVTDPELIAYCQKTSDFSVQILPEEKKKVELPAPVIKREEPEPETEERSSRGKMR